MRVDNLIVHGMWIGNTLSPLELLTITSFLSQGHQFVLWHYEPLEQELPAGLVLRDAREIIPLEQVFSYANANQWGHGKGSYAGFSDIFRYKLLHDHGGWWTDMDVTCLKALDFNQAYVFRQHDVLAVVGNVMKAPKGSPLMLDCYRRASKSVNANNEDWLLPIRILNDGIVAYGLEQHIIPGMSNADRWDIVEPFTHSPKKFNKSWFVFHWMNEEWRYRGINKAQCLKGSRLLLCYTQHGIAVRQMPNYPWLNSIRAFLNKWYRKVKGRLQPKRG